MTERMLRAPEVMRLTTLGRTTIWRLERDGRFPRRRRIGGGLTVWLASEVEEWMRSRPAADDERERAETAG